MAMTIRLTQHFPRSRIPLVSGIYGLGRFQREQPTMQLCASMALSLSAILILLLKLRSVTEILGRDVRESHLLSSNLLFHLPPSPQSGHPFYNVSFLTYQALQRYILVVLLLPVACSPRGAHEQTPIGMCGPLSVVLNFLLCDFVFKTPEDGGRSTVALEARAHEEVPVAV
jgi:hypothetical protein